MGQSSDQPLQIALAGLGTVGRGVINILNTNQALLEQRCGRPLEIVAVSARDRSRDRGVDVSGYAWHDDARELAGLENVDVVVELIGGSEGVAKELCEQALAGGKHVVTANKALIAMHGTELAAAAEQYDRNLAFEAAVAGGIPILRSLRRGLAANAIGRVVGILNGTANYILTMMSKSGRDFADVLKEAQDKGYAEADPSFDIDGVDTAHKLAILASIAFGTRVDFSTVSVEGIRAVAQQDIQNAAALGYVIKLLGIAEPDENGAIRQRVHPAMVPEASPVAKVDDVFNAVYVEGNFVDQVVFEGPGAGEGPTASAVVADIIDIARGDRYNPFSIPASQLGTLRAAEEGTLETSYYLRIVVTDQPGVLEGIAGAFSRHGISVKSLEQHGHEPGTEVQLVFTTHRAKEADMQAALKEIEALPAVEESPHMIRIEDL